MTEQQQQQHHHRERAMLAAELFRLLPSLSPGSIPFRTKALTAAIEHNRRQYQALVRREWELRKTA